MTDKLREAAQQALEAGCNCTPDGHAALVALRAALAEQEQAEPSPTSGMNIAQRILHVGGRNNAAGYVEFGSIQAVQALVRQVIRDLPRPRRIPDHELVTMYDESPSSDADMIAFAHDVMDAMIYNSPQPAKQPLTDEEINNVVNEVLAATSPRVGYLEIARAVERAHGINVPQARGEQE